MTDPMRGVSLADALHAQGFSHVEDVSSACFVWFAANRRPILEGARFVHPDSASKQAFDALLEAARRIGEER